MDIEFVVPSSNDPKPETERGKALKKLIETPVELQGLEGSPRGVGDVRPKEGAATPAPKITLDVEVPDPKKLREPTKDEIHLATLDHDDPRVLLQQQFGTLPGVDPERAAAMANSMDGALHNMNVAARRELDLARRKAAREARGGGKRKGKRRRRRR